VKRETSFVVRRSSSVLPFFAALQFLTLVPPVVRRAFTPQELGRAVGFYPLVGALLGLVLAGLNEGLARVLMPGVVPALVLTGWVVLTGALHLDGFLDSCDGLLGGWTPEKRLHIMRDERVGAFGLAGGVLLLLLKLTALSAVSRPTAALILAPTLGRWAMALAVVAFPYARPEGLGKAVKDHAAWRQVALATVFALATAALAGGWQGLVALAMAALTTLIVARFALARLPGLTGDLYGAICEIVELATLLFWTTQWSS
jgi:adenosylcobinamide-GDP ribazoletransferase